MNISPRVTSDHTLFYDIIKVHLLFSLFWSGQPFWQKLHTVHLKECHQCKLHSGGKKTGENAGRGGTSNFHIPFWMLLIFASCQVININKNAWRYKYWNIKHTFFKFWLQGHNLTLTMLNTLGTIFFSYFAFKIQELSFCFLSGDDDGTVSFTMSWWCWC